MRLCPEPPLPRAHRPASPRRASAWLVASLLALAGTAGAVPPAPKPVVPKPSAKPAAHSTAKAAVKPAVTSAAKPANVAKSPPAQHPGADLDKWCHDVAAIDPEGGVERCLSLQLTEGTGRSVKGVPLWSTDVVPAAENPAPLRVLVLGGIHADEEASVVLVMDWIARARQAATARPVHWRMAPLVNPDGFFVPARTRVNFHGVDLNRNFATHQWSAEAHNYWIKATRRDPRRFPGPTALSEPESQWVHQQIASFQPNLIVSVHAPYGVLDFDGPPPPPSRLGNLMLDQVGIYPGSLGNYGGIVLGVPVVTIELKQAKRVTASDAAAMWSDLQRWIGDKFLNADGSTRLGQVKALPRPVN